jgi:AraC-like DNA-binding protein
MVAISNLMKQLAIEEGFNATLIPGARIFKASQYQPRQPLCYDQGVIIVGQGTKRIYLGGKLYEYNPDNYLVLSVPLPAECETIASEEVPLLALIIDFEIAMLNRVVEEMDHYFDHTHLRRRRTDYGLFLAKTTPEIKNSTLRLLQALQSPIESKVIGSGIVHELIFRIMCGENSCSLYSLTMNNTKLARVNKALKLIHGSYQSSMDVEKLANVVHMSPSSFHRAFKEVTSSSPIQYVKKLRLDKARNLLIDQGVRVNEAANEVGYESVTQFSREFKRYFGNSPARFIAGRNT